MQSSTKWILLGALVSLASSSCKSDPPAPKVIAESATPKPAAPPSASAVASASTTALPPYGPDDMLADIHYCAQFWLGSIASLGGRCDLVLPLWSEGGVETAVNKYKSGCDNKDGKACLLLIGALAHPKSPMQSKDRAVYVEDVSALLVKACEFGEPNACIEVVNRHRCVSADQVYDKTSNVCTSHIVKFLKGKKHPEFAALLEPGCKKGHAASCTAQADHMEEFKGQVDDVTELFKRACDLGDSHGCLRAESIAEKFGNEAERVALMTKKFSWDERACLRLNECGNIAADYNEGWHRPEQLPKIRELLTTYCAKRESNDTRCLALTQMQIKGAGGPVDAPAAVPRLKAICDTPINPDDPAMAVQSTSVACRMLATLYKNGTGVEKDEAKAKALMKRACIQRDPSTPEIDAACADLKAMGK